MGLDLEPSDVIGGGRLCSMIMQLASTELAIRPCRESETGWPSEGQTPPGNHSSIEVNERGPALKVFWPRNGIRGGRWPDQRGACLKGRLGLKVGLPKKNRAGGSIDGARSKASSGPLLSVRIRRQGIDSAHPR